MFVGSCADRFGWRALPLARGNSEQKQNSHCQTESAACHAFFLSFKKRAGLQRPYTLASRFSGKYLPAIEAPEKAPMQFIKMSVIVGYRTGENTWYSSQVMDTATPTSAASHIDLTPACPRTLAYAKPKGT
jgi:hypothetical protein